MPVTPDVVGDRILDAHGSGVAAGLKELEKLAGQLEDQGATRSARTLRDSFPDVLTVDLLGLEPPLVDTLSTTHVIGQARFGLTGQICRPPTWRNMKMALHWTAASFAVTVERRRRIKGYFQLPSLTAGLRGPGG